VTNNPAKAKEFLESCPCGAITKALGFPALLYKGRAAASLYTHRVTKQDKSALDSVRFGPTLLQEFLRKEANLRTTVIGRKVFSVSIATGDVEDAKYDFRRADILSLPHSPITLPHEVEKACRDVVKSLGLNFGAIDLLRTIDGDLVFLEVNPNGQWLWLETLTGLPMSVTMAKLLAQPIRGGRKQQQAWQGTKRFQHLIPAGRQSLDIPTNEARASKRGHEPIATSVRLNRVGDAGYIHIGDLRFEDSG
jgi:hypothetical protein